MHESPIAQFIDPPAKQKEKYHKMVARREIFGEAKLEVVTQLDFDSGVILQEMFHNDHIGRDPFSRQVMYTKDAHIRDALIKLGWTPPA